MPDEIPSVEGGTYIRWGRTSCANGSDIMYSGKMGGSQFNEGGGYNPQCFPLSPEYLETSGRSGHMPGLMEIKAAGYQITHGTLNTNKKLTNERVPCSVCMAKHRASILMIPGNTRCPDSAWTEEYVGYLMAEHQNNKRSEFICVDKHAEPTDTLKSTNGFVLHHQAIKCSNFGNCPPYKDGEELACVLCSK